MGIPKPECSSWSCYLVTMSLRRKGQSGDEDSSNDWNVTRGEEIYLMTLVVVDKCKVEGNKEDG